MGSRVRVPYAPQSYEAKSRKVLKFNTLGLFCFQTFPIKSRRMAQLALAYPLDFLKDWKVQRFGFVFADSQYFA
jgi:hypothetical protein